ncbi:MAG: hypothetical protein WD981_02560 [Gaiellaceae bacterium]
MHDPNRPGTATSTDVWSFGTEPTIGDVDLTGFKVEAADGSIGKVDEATYEAGSSYLIVDTGPWIFGKKVMLPAGVVQRVDPESETVFVSRTKDEIKNAPEFDDATADAEYRNRLGEYYGPGLY